MSVPKTISEVRLLEVNGKEVPMIDGPILTVRSHWNDDELVELEVEGRRVLVRADEMLQAIDRCCG